MSKLQDNGPFCLAKAPVHLGLGATAVPQEDYVPEIAWFAGYAQRHAADGAEGRLVSVSTFSEGWGHWEMHPEGAEVVLVLSGRLAVHQELGDEAAQVSVGPGEYVVNPPGVWHTADVEEGPATVLFVTAGKGTEHRSR